jgi:hypothetical protein
MTRFGGKPGRIKLDDEEKINRAYNYATDHDSIDIPALRNRMDELEQKFLKLVEFMNRNMAKNDGAPRG